MPISGHSKIPGFQSFFPGLLLRWSVWVGQSESPNSFNFVSISLTICFSSYKSIIKRSHPFNYAFWNQSVFLCSATFFIFFSAATGTRIISPRFIVGTGWTGWFSLNFIFIGFHLTEIYFFFGFFAWRHLNI